MDQSGLATERVRLGHQLVSHVASHSKVRILVNSTRNKTGHVGITASTKGYGERGRERWSCLNSGKGNLTNVGGSIKAKDSINYKGR